MGVGEWAALGSLAVSLVVTIATGAYIAGRHAQRIESSEDKIKALEGKSDGHSLTMAEISKNHAGALAEISGMKELLGEVRRDIKDLLSRRAPRRTGDA